jgi:hypothetical protein
LTLGQPHHAADFRKSSHISVSGGTSKKTLSLHFLFVVGIFLFGKPTSSPSGQREHPPCLAVALSTFTPLIDATLSVSMIGRRRIIDGLVMVSCIDVVKTDSWKSDQKMGSTMNRRQKCGQAFLFERNRQ